MTVVPDVLCMIDQNSNRTSKTIKHLAVKCQYQERADVIGDFVTARCGKSGNCIIFAETKKEASELALSDNLSGQFSSSFEVGIDDFTSSYLSNVGRKRNFKKKNSKTKQILPSFSDAQMIHGDIEQKTREKTLQAFREGKVRCLVATDVAARGLDIPEIDLVIQTAPPSDIDSYIHRSGRTGRAGREGTCICLYKPQQVSSIL